MTTSILEPASRKDFPRRCGRVAVICSQINHNPGQSVTNAVEEIAFQVCDRFEIDPAKLIWIEHYPRTPYIRAEWLLVTFRGRPPQSMFSGPSWKRMTREDWQTLGLRPRGKAETSNS